MGNPPDEPLFQFVELGRPDDPADPAPDDTPAPGPASVLDRIGRGPLVGAVLVAVLVAGVCLGYAAHRTATKTLTRQVTTTATVTTTPSETPATPYDQVAMTGARCTTPVGPRVLQIGFEIGNGLRVPVRLTGVQGDFSGDSLQQLDSVRGPCGQLPGREDNVADYEIAPGASVWVTVTVRIPAACPQFFPVRLAVSYEVAGQPTTTHMSPFPDLGNLSFSGCASRQR